MQLNGWAGRSCARPADGRALGRAQSARATSWCSSAHSQIGVRLHGYSLALRLAHKKRRDIFFKIGYAAEDESYTPH